MSKDVEEDDTRMLMKTVVDLPMTNHRLMDHQERLLEQVVAMLLLLSVVIDLMHIVDDRCWTV